LLLVKYTMMGKPSIIIVSVFVFATLAATVSSSSSPPDYVVLSTATTVYADDISISRRLLEDEKTVIVTNALQAVSDGCFEELAKKCPAAAEILSDVYTSDEGVIDATRVNEDGHAAICNNFERQTLKNSRSATTRTTL
jgi:hypothetical protein